MLAKIHSLAAMPSISAQISRHSVAIISLVVALSGLAYNTWRNELTEANRNVRTAGIQTLLKLGQLDEVVFYSHYENDTERGSPRTGWALVLTVRDLGELMPSSASRSASALVTVWQGNWTGLGDDDTAATAISDAIDGHRNQVRTALAELD